MAVRHMRKIEQTLSTCYTKMIIYIFLHILVPVEYSITEPFCSCHFVQPISFSRIARQQRLVFNVPIVKIQYYSKAETYYKNSTILTIDLLQKLTLHHSHIPQCTIMKQKCAHFCCKKWCTVWYSSDAWWDLWDWSIENHMNELIRVNEVF